jgi:ATP-binding cassette subfamily B (MDR/TAP) protein 7
MPELRLDASDLEKGISHSLLTQGLKAVCFPGALALPESLRGYDLELDNVFFSYRDDQPMLQVSQGRLPLCKPFVLQQLPHRCWNLPMQGVSFTVPAGTSCAIVGTSGSGK